MVNPSLHAAADQLTRLVRAVPDDALDSATPCPELSLGALLDHVGIFAQVFAASARKDIGARTAKPPDADASHLEEGWRDRMATDLDALAHAWDAPDAWKGMTQAGGQDLPGEVCGRIALDELVVHGWDVARTIDRPFEAAAADLEEVGGAVTSFRDGNTGELPGLFGPVVPVPDDAPPLERVLGLTGRDPAWQPSA